MPYWNKLLRFLIVVDPRENRKKCTLTPLEGAPGVTFLRPRPGAVEVPPGILLHLEGPVLSSADRELLAEGLLILPDASWARLPKLLARMAPRSGARLERRSLPHDLATAYPRVSKLRQDPARGLASVEALFAATAILGEPREDLLDAYRWKDEFLARNSRLFPT
jgi:pre-rRNA-processing protein TSR3